MRPSAPTFKTCYHFDWLIGDWMPSFSKNDFYVLQQVTAIQRSPKQEGETKHLDLPVRFFRSYVWYVLKSDICAYTPNYVIFLLDLDSKQTEDDE